ncbi:MAG: DsbA family protein [Minisyncoccia bacterium]
MPFFTIRMKNTLVLAGSIIIAGIFIGAGVYLSKLPTKGNIVKAPEQVQEKQAVVKTLQPDDHIVGPRDAKVIVIEYSDPECPFCKIFHTTMLSLMADKAFNGKIAWVYRHFPIDSLHSRARYEAQALECASVVGGNDAFWRLTDKLYSIATSNDTLDTSILPDLAQSVGLSKTEFTTCLTSGKTAAKVESDYQDGVAAGADGTPYSIIIGPNGQKIPVKGAVPLVSLKIQIQSLLAN